MIKGLLYTFCEICVTIGSFYYIFIQYSCDNYFAIYLALQTFDADLSWQSLNITHKSIEKVYIVYQDDIFNIISVEHISFCTYFKRLRIYVYTTLALLKQNHLILEIRYPLSELNPQKLSPSWFNFFSFNTFVLFH